MEPKFTFKGSLYQSKGRWYWKVTLPNQSARRSISLGKTGEESPYSEGAAKAMAQRVWDEAIKESKGILPKIKTVAELKAAYIAWAESTYAKGRSVLWETKLALALIDKDQIPVDDFGPLRLQQAMDKLINSGKRLSVRTVNGRTNILRRMFQWGVAREYVRPETAYALKMVKNVDGFTVGVKPTQARDIVSIEIVQATLPHLSSVLQAMVRVQLFTGMRPSEVCSMRSCDISTEPGRDFWIYAPKAKNDWRGSGYERKVPIGKKAQEILLPLMAKKQQFEYLFTPAEACQEIRHKRTAERKTPLSCGNRAGKNLKNTLKMNAFYNEDSYRTAVVRACQRAFPLPDHLAPRNGESKISWGKRLSIEEKKQVKKWYQNHHWTPYQLRHTAATLVRAGCGDNGLSAVQAFLGQKSFDVAEFYAKINTSLMRDAVKVINKIEI